MPSARKLTVFRAELLSCDQASWEELFDGFTALQAITFSSSLEMLLRLADRLDTLEIVFGSEKILSREHLALTQASQTIQPYGFADALVDQKALVEALARLLGRTGQRLLERVAAGTLRFRLLRGRPSRLRSSDRGERIQRGRLFRQCVLRAEAGEAAAIVGKYRDGGPEPAASGFRRQSRSVRNAQDRDRSQQGRIVERGRRNRIWPRDRGNLAHRGNT